MTMITQQHVRGRPAHPLGRTSLAYTPNGRKLVTAGSNNVIRVYTTGSDGEPVNIDDCQEENTSIIASNDFFVTGSEDGKVCMYSLETYTFDKLLTRCTLPIRDLTLSHDERWVAVASDDIEVKIVDVRDMTNVLYLREHPKPAKHLAFHPRDAVIAVSCTDGIIYIYDWSVEPPALERKIDGIIRSIESDDETSSQVIWHPDGRALAAPTATRDIQVVSKSDGEKQRVFGGGHAGDITSLAWSSNGALLLTSGSDGKILLWETKNQTVLTRYDYPNVIDIAWHPYENLVSFVTSDGELFIYASFVPTNYCQFLEKPLQPSPFIHDPLEEISGNARRILVNGHEGHAGARDKRRGTPDSLDEILGPESDIGGDDFVSDDDGAGYLDDINEFGKRGNGHLDPIDGFESRKRSSYQTWQPKLHQSFQPGSTPWRGNRKYLCLNLTGFVWTVDQDTHNTVTVEFYDREFHRDFHFTDPYLYDKACLNESGTLFSCPPANDSPAMIFYRPHETWTSRVDWRTQLPFGEDITSISLSESYVFVTTTANYVRIFTLFGTPFGVYRQKSSPTVTCASWQDYVLTMGNGPVGGDGATKLLYTIENVKRDEVCQSEDTVALTEGAEVKNVFFSDNGDPCIYDSTGVLLILQHWRTPGQAKWVPILDTKLLDRLATGRKEETYWPVAVAQDKFHCIILKGGDQNPYFPRPLLSEFALQIPHSTSDPHPSNPDSDDAANPPTTAATNSHLEKSLLLQTLQLSLLEDLFSSSPSPSSTSRFPSPTTELHRRETEIDKILLQLLNLECQEGEHRGMKALEIVRLMRGHQGRMLEAAGKIAARNGRGVRGEKIEGLVAERLLGEEEGG